jgi:hypothetical protein
MDALRSRQERTLSLQSYPLTQGALHNVAFQDMMTLAEGLGFRLARE